MRNVARLKMGYYPLPESEAPKIRSLLSFPQPAAVIDPCVGEGVALHMVTAEAELHRYGVELDAERARIAAVNGIHTTQGNSFDVIVKSQSCSLVYLNPPYDSEIGSVANARMEQLFLQHTYRWLVIGGVLVLVIPYERLSDCTGVLSSHFKSLKVFRLTDEAAVEYRQIVIFGERSDISTGVVDANKHYLQSISPYGRYGAVPELIANGCSPYSVPSTGPLTPVYRGLPYDLLEDLLPASSAWRQVAPFLVPKDDTATGRPITPLHGGHVGLLCTAGLLNGVFGQDEQRHIARWRSIKHTTTFTEIDGDTEIVHHRERWANELRVVYSDGRTMKLTETPPKKEEQDGECTPEARAA